MGVQVRELLLRGRRRRPSTEEEPVGTRHRCPCPQAPSTGSAVRCSCLQEAFSGLALGPFLRVPSALCVGEAETIPDSEQHEVGTQAGVTGVAAARGCWMCTLGRKWPIRSPFCSWAPHDQPDRELLRLGVVYITPQGHPESERWGGVRCKPTAGQPVSLDLPVVVSPHSPLMMLCAQQCSGDAGLIGLNFRLLKSDRNWGNRLEKVLGPL